jgi:HEAT repeat protein
VRDTAAHALSQRGEVVLDLAPEMLPALLRTLDDPSASACAHAARLLASVSHRLTRAQRVAALAGVDRAIARFEDQPQSYARFNSMSMHAASFLQQQRGPLQTPTVWDVNRLLAEFAFPRMEDRWLSPAECTRRLAAFYAGAPRETLAAVLAAVQKQKDRTAAIGAAHWLATLGPAAEPALPALDAMGSGKLDPYAREQARPAAEAIRQSLQVEPDAEEGPTARGHIARLARLMREGVAPDSDLSVPELTGFLAHPDPYVRAGAAELLAALSPSPARVSDALPALAQLLTDEAGAEVGITGPYEFDGQLYHWRQERRSPRAAAIRALFRFGWIPEGEGLLKAMIAETMHAAVICGGSAAPHRFSIAQWRRAVAAAGGLSLADPLLRTARQQCLQARCGSNTLPGAMESEAELAEVIRQLSGRRV